MNHSEIYLVAGATGNVGGEIVTQLLAAGKSVRVLVRDPAKAAARWGDRVQVVVGDLAKPATSAGTFTGIAGAFLLNRGLESESLDAFLAEAKAAGVLRIVFLSTLLAGDPSSEIGQIHKAQEDAIRASGLAGKFLRPGGFMTNSYQWIPSIKAEGVVYNPMGSGRSAPVSPEDIAAIAVKALTSPGAEEAIYEITGGELLSVPEQAEILAGILGRELRCVDIPSATAVENLRRAGTPAHVAEAVGRSFDAIREGRGVVIRDTVEKELRRPPQTYAAWARRNASRFA
ncbi:MAG: hypothetical protein JWO82_2124 [Akkermansiaceae bacterium]|nr:hypothetical protein [Akkermansiaceae bacterium]